MADQGKKKTSASPTPATAGAGARAAAPQPVYVGGDSLADRLMPHVKKIIGGLVALGAVITIVFTVKYCNHRKAEKSTDGVLHAIDDDSRAIKPPADTDGGVGVASGSDDEDQTFPTTGDRAAAVLADLSKVSGAPRDGVGMLEAAQLYDAGRFDDAASAYRKLASRPGLEGVQAREGVGFALEAKAEAPGVSDTDKQAALSDALEAFKAMQPDDAGPGRASALYHQGRILAAMGKKDDARTAFSDARDKAKNETPADDDLVETIDTRLIQLDAPPPLPPLPKTAEKTVTPPDKKPATPPADKKPAPAPPADKKPAPAPAPADKKAPTP